MGIQRLEFLGYRDSGMDGTPENGDPRAVVQAGPEAVKAQLVGLIRQLKPDVAITFEPFGWYGHPDHIAVSRWVTEVYPSVGDASAYPEQGEAWQPSRLFHAVIPFSRFGAMIEEAVAAGYLQMDGNGSGFDIPAEQQMKTEAAVTHVIDIQHLFDLKQKGMRAHQTPFGEDSMFRKIPRELMQKANPDEHFIQIQPAPTEGLTQNRLSDLFAGV